MLYNTDPFIIEIKAVPEAAAYHCVQLSNYHLFLARVPKNQPERQYPGFCFQRDGNFG